MFFHLLMSAAFLYGHLVDALCLLVLCLCAGDTLFAQVLIAAYVSVGESAAFLNEDGNTH